jgi:predicted PurR-regulated permease PerM
MIKLIKKLQKLIIFFGLLFLIYLMIIGKINSLFSNTYSKSNNSKIFNNIKRILKDKIYKYFNKNITNIDSLYIKGNLRFGNYFISLNNAIIFCEVMSCKKIIIFNHRNNFIK